MSQPLLKAGLSQASSDALRRIGITAEQVVQTIGSARASAGTHDQDGILDGHAYSAAVDLSVHHPHVLTTRQIQLLLVDLSKVGFVAYYRDPGQDHWPRGEAEHVHAVYAGVAMKEALRAQVHDFLHVPTLNGLASHAPYAFYQPSPAIAQSLRTLFLAHNPAQG